MRKIKLHFLLSSTAVPILAAVLCFLLQPDAARGGAAPAPDTGFDNPGRFVAFFGDQNAGLLNMKVTHHGAVSGSVKLAGRTAALRGSFNSSGVYGKVISGIDLQFNLDPTGSSHLLTGTITLDGSASPVSVETDNGAPAPSPAKFTALIAPDSGAGIEGYGAGSFTVHKDGNATFAGHLGDGTAVTAGGPIVSGSIWYFYLPLYRKAGLIAGPVTFQHLAGMSDFAGNLTWDRIATTHAAGFTAAPTMIGSAYFPSVPALNLATPGMASFSAGGLTGTTTYAGLTFTHDKIKAEGFSLDVGKGSGTVTGKFLPTGSTKSLSFYGAVFQDQDTAAGYFSGTSGKGSFLFGE